MKTPEPRLPLEPEEYPMYKPPRRLGCSGLSIVTLVMLFIFAFLFWRVTPGIVEGVKTFSADKLNLLPNSSDQGTPDTTPGETNLATQTAVVGAAAPTAILPSIATPTVAHECVQVVGTSVTMRTEPRSGAPSALVDANGNTIKAKTGTTFYMIEDNATPAKGSSTGWKHVQLLPPDGRTGYVPENNLSPVPCP